MTSAELVAHYKHCLARDWEFSYAAHAWLKQGGTLPETVKLLTERAPYRLAVLDMLEVFPCLAKLGKPDWVDELNNLSH